MNTTVMASLIILIILVIAFMMMGMWFRKLTVSASDYLMAGRNIPFWLLAGSFVGGQIGGATVSGYTGYGYSSGWASSWSGIFVLIGAVIFTIVYVKRLNYFGRTTDAYTITDFICTRYDERLRIPAGIIAFFRPAAQCGMQLLAIAVVLKVAFEIPLNFGTIIAAAIIFLYTFTAGQYSAIIVQWLQSIIQSAAMVISVFAAMRMIGDPNVAIDAFYSALPPFMVNAMSIAPATFMTWAFTLGAYYLACPTMFMWAYVGKDPKTTVNAQMMLTGANFFGVLPYFCGMAVAAAAAIGVIVVPEMGSDQIFSWLGIYHSPVVIGCVMIVGLMMTILSTGSSLVMNGAAILAKDIYVKGVNKHNTVSDPQLLKFSRIAVVLTLIIGVAVANGIPQLVTLWVMIQAIVMSGIWVPVMCAWHWKRATATGALAACVGGAVVACIWAAVAWTKMGAPSSMLLHLHCVHAGFIVSVILMIVVSLATKHSPDEDIEATNFKTLGDKMNAADPDYFPGVFGFFGAKTAAKKFIWTGCLVMLALHFVVVPLFKYQPVGTFYVWCCLLVSILFMILFLVLGGRDLKEMVAEMKAAIAKGKTAENK